MSLVDKIKYCTVLKQSASLKGNYTDCIRSNSYQHVHILMQLATYIHTMHLGYLH